MRVSTQLPYTASRLRELFDEVRGYRDDAVFTHIMDIIVTFSINIQNNPEYEDLIIEISNLLPEILDYGYEQDLITGLDATITDMVTTLVEMDMLYQGVTVETIIGNSMILYRR